MRSCTIPAWTRGRGWSCRTRAWMTRRPGARGGLRRGGLRCRMCARCLHGAHVCELTRSGGWDISLENKPEYKGSIFLGRRGKTIAEDGLEEYQDRLSLQWHNRTLAGTQQPHSNTTREACSSQRPEGGLRTKSTAAGMPPPHQRGAAGATPVLGYTAATQAVRYCCKKVLKGWGRYAYRHVRDTMHGTH